MAGRLYITGAVVNPPDEMLFKADRPHRACMICGAVFQSTLDRTTSPTPAQQMASAAMRKSWANKHAREAHTPEEHQALQASGMLTTPEATVRLAPFGIIPLNDMHSSPEHAHAGHTAPRLPNEDAEHETTKMRREYS